VTLPVMTLRGIQAQAPGAGCCRTSLKGRRAIMVSTDLAARVAARRSARPVEDLSQWRDRLEQLWRPQVEKIIELSLAYHGGASAARTSGWPAPAGFCARQLRRILTRTAAITLPGTSKIRASDLSQTAPLTWTSREAIVKRAVGTGAAAAPGREP